MKISGRVKRKYSSTCCASCFWIEPCEDAEPQQAAQFAELFARGRSHAVLDRDLRLVHPLAQRIRQTPCRRLHFLLDFADVHRCRLDLRGQHVDLRRVALRLRDDRRRPFARRVDQVLRRPVRTDRETEAVLGRLPDQDLDDVRKLLVQRALRPRILAVLQHVLHGLFGERRRVVEELRAQEVLERRRDEVRVELERQANERLEVAMQRNDGFVAKRKGDLTHDGSRFRA